MAQWWCNREDAWIPFLSARILRYFRNGCKGFSWFRFKLRSLCFTIVQMFFGCRDRWVSLKELNSDPKPEKISNKNTTEIPSLYGISEYCVLSTPLTSNKSMMQERLPLSQKNSWTSHFITYTGKILSISSRKHAQRVSISAHIRSYPRSTINAPKTLGIDPEMIRNSTTHPHVRAKSTSLELFQHQVDDHSAKLRIPASRSWSIVLWYRRKDAQNDLSTRVSTHFQMKATEFTAENKQRPVIRYVLFSLDAI